MSIKILMVSGCRLAWHREIVSQPSEKTCSAATADPKDGLAKEKKRTQPIYTHPVYKEDHMQTKKGWKIGHVGPSTSE
jgi:hypothetical protein